jgi:hypothetical protein
MVAIDDLEVVRTSGKTHHPSGKTHHPIVAFTGQGEDRVRARGAYSVSFW